MGRETEQEKPQQAPEKTFSPWRILLFWGIGILLISLFLQDRSPPNEISYSEFRQELRGGNVAVIVMRGEEIEGTFRQPVEPRNHDERPPLTDFRTRLPAVGDDQLLALVDEQHVELQSRSPPRDWGLLVLLSIPFLFLLLIALLAFHQLRQRGQGLLSFTQSRARLYDRQKVGVSFNDVAGTEGAKEELQQTVSFLKDPGQFKRLGAKTPRGVLLVGPPGTGKTLLAKAVAGEAGVPFFSVTGSDFMEMFVGIGAARVRKMFEDAKRAAPSIIFIDELDSIGRRRGTGIGGGHDEREQTLNQLLSELDGFEGHENIIVMAATNRPDILDKALLRPGRFDRQITVDLPNQEGRHAILKIHARGKKISAEVDLERLSRATPGFSGADLENLLNEAALVATLRNKESIEPDDVALARDKILLGRRREGLHLPDEDLRLLAYHEAGHALAAILLPHTDPIEKVTIVPRGQAMGTTQQLPERDRYLYNKDYLLDHLAVMMGGRAAEDLVFHTATSGATRDFEQATHLARRMVAEFGMSDALSRMHLAGRENVFLGEELARHRDYSERTAEIVDQEIRRLLDEAYRRVRSLLEENRERLDRLAEKLLEKEEISGDEALVTIGIPREKARRVPATPRGRGA